VAFSCGLLIRFTAKSLL